MLQARLEQHEVKHGHIVVSALYYYFRGLMYRSMQETDAK